MKPAGNVTVQKQQRDKETHCIDVLLLLVFPEEAGVTRIREKHAVIGTQSTYAKHLRFEIIS